MEHSRGCGGWGFEHSAPKNTAQGLNTFVVSIGEQTKSVEDAHFLPLPIYVSSSNLQIKGSRMAFPAHQNDQIPAQSGY
jgi:hypothetical protein